MSTVNEPKSEIAESEGPKTHDEARWFHQGVLSGLTQYAREKGDSCLKSENELIRRLMDAEGFRTLDEFERVSGSSEIIDEKRADKSRCSGMGAAERLEIHTNIMQALINCGLNAFAFDLMAESLLKSPAPQRLDIVFPVSRTDCAQWAGVRFVLEPIPVAT